MDQRFRTAAAVVVAVVSGVALAACGGSNEDAGASGGSAGGSTQLNLAGFAVPKAANDAAQAAFARTPAGVGVTWTTSYGPSGDQSRAVVAGLEADYVHFSLEGDVTRLVDEGLVADDWDAGEHKGIVSESVVVLVVRKGNPKEIQGWDDLVQAGVGIVTPNPGSSGSARWNILGAWGHVTANGGSDAEAEVFLTKLFDNVVALPGGGRDATTAFVGGTGDVLLSYENEAILARQSGEDFEYVIPETTLLIENPGAVLKDADPKAQAYLDFVLSKTGQTEFAKKGFRPIVDGVDVDVEGANDPSDPFPAVRHLLTIADDFGGWPNASKRFFDEEMGIVTRIQQATGRS
jgi:sulfate/thiosulfate-binding protein